MITKRAKAILLYVCGFMESYLSAIILVGLIIFSVNVVIDIIRIVPAFFNENDSFFVREFLGKSLELIIGIEFVKMIANNTPGSTIEVLIFSIAKTIIVSHETPMFELLWGVVAIVLLFVVRKWAHKFDRNIVESIKKKPRDKELSIAEAAVALASDENVYDANVLVSRLNEMLHVHIPARVGDTIGSLVYSCVKARKGHVLMGDKLEIGGTHLEIHKMEDERIMQVKVIPDGKDF